MHPWYKNAIFYELYIRAFRDTNGDGHGDLRGVIEKLDYLQHLGVDCIWLLPMYPSPLKDDGYDITDFYNIHPDYGTLDDFKELVQAAHNRGLRVIADLVLNHTSDQHPWFQAARADRNSPYRHYYVWSDTDQKYKDARIIFLDVETSNWTWDEQAGQYYWHRFYSSQPDLNYDNPAVQDEMLNIARFWLELGIDGFRVDAPPYLFEREGTNCENLPETHAFLKRFRLYVEQINPQAVLLSEANQWPEDVRPYFGDGDEMHMNFHFPLMPRMFQALAQHERTPIVEILQRTPPLPENCQWATFLRCHDELTLEMVTPEVRQFMWNFYAPHPRMRLNLGIRRRLAPLVENDRRRIELLYSLLFTLPGAPTLYYGDEIGMGDNIWLEDRNGLRTPMQWDSSPNAGFTEPGVRPYAPVIDDPIFGYKQVNVAAQMEDPNSLLNTIRKMIAIRKAHPVLGDANLEWLDAPIQVAAFLRRNSHEIFISLNNLSDSSQTVTLPAGIFRGLFDQRILRDQITLSPYQYWWGVQTQG
ncbi:MAG: maltose alpha-D-glucosyltransferase [Anaerolineales bacterium]